MPNENDELPYKPRDFIFPESCESEPLRVRVGSNKKGLNVNRVILHRLPYECETSFLPIVKIQNLKKLPKMYEYPSIQSKDTVFVPALSDVKIDSEKGNVLLLVQIKAQMLTLMFAFRKVCLPVL